MRIAGKKNGVFFAVFFVQSLGAMEKEKQNPVPYHLPALATQQDYELAAFPLEYYFTLKKAKSALMLDPENSAALQTLELLATHSNYPPAQHHLGLLALAKNDSAQALLLFKKAADNLYIPSMYKSSVLKLSNSQLTPNEQEECLTTLKSLANPAKIDFTQYPSSSYHFYYPPALDYLANLYRGYDRYGIKPDKEAVSRLDSLARLHGIACPIRAHWLALENLKAKNFSLETEQYFHEALTFYAQNENFKSYYGEALDDLGFYYRSREHADEQAALEDYKKAWQLFKEAESRGCLLALLDQAFMAFHGYGLESPNYDQAYEFLEKALNANIQARECACGMMQSLAQDHNNLKAQKFLVDAFAAGKHGFEQSGQKALAWFKQVNAQQTTAKNSPEYESIKNFLHDEENIEMLIAISSTEEIIDLLNGPFQQWPTERVIRFAQTPLPSLLLKKGETAKAATIAYRLGVLFKQAAQAQEIEKKQVKLVINQAKSCFISATNAIFNGQLESVCAYWHLVTPYKNGNTTHAKFAQAVDKLKAYAGQRTEELNMLVKKGIAVIEKLITQLPCALSYHHLADLYAQMQQEEQANLYRKKAIELGHYLAKASPDESRKVENCYDMLKRYTSHNKDGSGKLALELLHEYAGKKDYKALCQLIKMNAQGFDGIQQSAAKAQDWLALLETELDEERFTYLVTCGAYDALKKLVLQSTSTDFSLDFAKFIKKCEPWLSDKAEYEKLLKAGLTHAFSQTNVEKRKSIIDWCIENNVAPAFIMESIAALAHQLEDEKSMNAQEYLQTALAYLKKLFDQQNKDATLLLYKLVKDTKERLTYLTKAAQYGDAQASYDLSLAYATGNGVEKSLPQAGYYCVQSWQQAAPNQIEQALKHMTIIAQEILKQGVQKDTVKLLYDAVAMLGQIDGPLALKCCTTAEAFLKNNAAGKENQALVCERAFDALKKLSQAGALWADYCLALIYVNTFSTPEKLSASPDSMSILQDALKYAQKSAQDTTLNAQEVQKLQALIETQLGVAYLLKQDIAQAMKYNFAAAEKGNLHALYASATFYLLGKSPLPGTEAVKKAIDYLTKAANQGNKESSALLIELSNHQPDQVSYYTPFITPDMRTAMITKLCELVAKKELPEDQKQKVEQLKNKEAQFKKAAEAFEFSSQAPTASLQMIEMGSYQYDKGNFQEALTWFMKALENQCHFALPYLARMHLTGSGVPQSDEQTFTYIERFFKYDNWADHVQAAIIAHSCISALCNKGILCSYCLYIKALLLQREIPWQDKADKIKTCLKLIEEEIPKGEQRNKIAMLDMMQCISATVSEQLRQQETLELAAIALLTYMRLNDSKGYQSAIIDLLQQLYDHIKMPFVENVFVNPTIDKTDASLFNDLCTALKSLSQRHGEYPVYKLYAAIFYLSGCIHKKIKLPRATGVLRPLELLAEGESALAATACYWLGRIYLDGSSFPGEFFPKTSKQSLASKYIDKAASLGDADALIYIGALHAIGIYKHYPKDLHKSITYFNAAKKKNHQLAGFNLGTTYFDNPALCNNDFNLIIDCFKHSHQATLPAISSLSKLYLAKIFFMKKTEQEQRKLSVSLEDVVKILEDILNQQEIKAACLVFINRSWIDEDIINFCANNNNIDNSMLSRLYTLVAQYHYFAAKDLTKDTEKEQSYEKAKMYALGALAKNDSINARCILILLALYDYLEDKNYAQTREHLSNVLKLLIKNGKKISDYPLLSTAMFSLKIDKAPELLKKVQATDLETLIFFTSAFIHAEGIDQDFSAALNCIIKALEKIKADTKSLDNYQDLKALIALFKIKAKESPKGNQLLIILQNIEKMHAKKS